MLQVRGRALFIVLQDRYEVWRQLQICKTVALNFHAKGEHQRPTSGAGLGLPPISHRLLVDALDSLLKSAVVAWLQRRQLEAGRPGSGFSRVSIALSC